MSSRKLVLVHGRSTKPAEKEKESLVKEALIHGLKRISSQAAEHVVSGDIKIEFIYYGDISNKILVEADPDLKSELDYDSGTGVWSEKPGLYKKPMQMLFSRSNENHTKKDYEQLLKKNVDLQYIDDIARLASPILAGGLSRRIILKYLPDLGGYINSRKIGSAIRQRLQGPLKEALLADDDVAIISHSMGCIAAYDVLWKFSQMSEYENVRHKKVSLWLTLGSPLGEPSVSECLYDSNEPKDGLYPRNILRWINISAKDDFIAHDGTIADDFADMKQYGCEIIDLPRIYTFWVSEKRSNPHKFYGYLDHPIVANQIASWILKSK